MTDLRMAEVCPRGRERRTHRERRDLGAEAQLRVRREAREAREAQAGGSEVLCKGLGSQKGPCGSHKSPTPESTTTMKNYRPKETHCYV